MTPEEVHDELSTAMRELRLEIRELRLDIREQLQRIELLIWLPVATGLIQILVAIITRK